MPTGYHDIPSEEEVWSEQCAGCMRFVCHLSVSSSNQSIPFLSRLVITIIYLFIYLFVCLFVCFS